MRTPKRLVFIIAVCCALIALPANAFAATDGSWEAYPGQSAAYESQIKPPIRADGSSVFTSKNSAKSVIPVKFGLLSGLGPFVFESIYSDSSPDNDFSFLSFTPSTPLKFKDITDLSADYTFTTGDCHGGSLRWSVRVSPTQSVFIYYGAYPNFSDCTSPDTAALPPAPPCIVTGDTNQSGENMVGKPDCRYDTSQVGGTFYDTYAHAVTLVGELPIVRASLVLDSGWGGDQRLALGSATVNDNTFTPPPATSLSSTCDLPPAEIRVTKDPGMPGELLVPSPTSIQPADTNGWFRVVDCKYMYNLATSSLLSSGRYKVEVVINGEAVSGAAYFSLK